MFLSLLLWTTEDAGVGLRNTVARLEQLYGAAQRFTLTPGADGGAVAEVRLPLRGARADALLGGAHVG